MSIEGYHSTSVDFLVSSNPNSGAKNKNSLGSSFDIIFEKAYVYDHKAKSIRLEILESELYFNQPNVGPEYSNQNVRIIGPNKNTAIIQVVDIVIPRGLYTPDSLNTAFQYRCDVANFPANMIQIVANDPINRIQLKFNNASAQVSMSNPIFHGFATLIGFIPNLYVANFVGELVTGQLLPTFNKINYFTITSNITSSATIVNGSATHVIARVLITGSAGYQILNSPNFPYSFDVSYLRGTNIKQLTFQLRDDSGNLVDTGGENWSLRYRLSYEY